MAMISRHCEKGKCKLAGFSVHCDREILYRQMRVLYNYMSFRILYVSTLFNAAKIWFGDLPWLCGDYHRVQKWGLSTELWEMCSTKATAISTGPGPSKSSSFNTFPSSSSSSSSSSSGSSSSSSGSSSSSSSSDSSSSSSSSSSSELSLSWLPPLLLLLLLDPPLSPPPTGLTATTGVAVGAMYPGEYDGWCPGTKGIP